jgi:putative tryptophan/tyrosine transport system substrate-binding protein
MNRRRALIKYLGASTLALPLAAFAQQSAKVPRIGFLISETHAGQADRIDALRAGLRDLGYLEGKNIAIEFRSAEGNYDRLPEIATELTRLRIDVLVAFGIKALVAAKRATTIIPIVIPATSGDLVAMGMISSLARPGGNITGSGTFGPEIMAKRLEVFKEMMPRITRVAVLVNPANPSFGPTLRQMGIAAKSLKLSLRPFEVRVRGEFDSVFATIAKRHVDVIMLQGDTLFSANAREIADLAVKLRLPAAGNKEFAEAGGLVGYAANTPELYRRGAYYVDRILKGAKPSDLPVEQPTKFDLVINIKTAKAIGIKIPQSIMLRADKVIE